VVPIEIEKKYRLTKKQCEEIQRRLPEMGAVARGQQFEENILFGGDPLPAGGRVLRLRRVGKKKATLTYKERLPSTESIKRQREDETSVGDAEAMESILGALGLEPRLVYEKRRVTWKLGKAEIVLDELPFGLFMEIEGPDTEIMRIERQLGIKRLRAEHATYPQLTERHGKRHGSLIESRFDEG
jgi:adenylate cyclase class 2